MGHAQGELGAFAVLQAEQVVAEDGPAAAFFQDVAGKQSGQEELLADLVHFLTHDGDDLVQRALAEEEIRVDAGAELPDIAGAEQELVAGDLGIGGRFTERGNEKLGPTVHADRDLVFFCSLAG